MCQNPNRAFSLACVLSCLLATLACGGAQTDSTPPDQEEVASSAELPPGHPPIGDTVPTPRVAPVDPGLGSGEAAMVWQAPSTWVAETPANSMRRAQYRVPGDEGDGQCVVYYFGPGMGGGAMDNAVRWAEQFTQPDGSPSVERMETTDTTVNGLAVLKVEVGGIYSTGSPMMGGTGESLPGYHLLGAIAEGPDANWFFKFTGPKSTIERHRADFDAMIGSLRAGAS